MEILTKTVKITNRRNVLVQVPGFIIASWPTAEELEVLYSERKGEIIIRPAVSKRSDIFEAGN